MSGVDDGSLLKCGADNGDGQRLSDDVWAVRIGRHDSNDICLNNDTFVSRQHARIYWKEDGWWLEDCESTNGTFIETPSEDRPVKEAEPIAPGQLFRIGRTWLRIELEE
jgi:pSer/pThr/pTyr-binding forkhead associated (FHA) protein